MIRSLLARLFGRRKGAGDDESGVTESEPADGDAEDPHGDESVDGDEEGSGSLWDLIQPWQYRGQYVQSGGDVRDEQERALQDIQRQAEEIERSERDTDPHPDS